MSNAVTIPQVDWLMIGPIAIISLFGIIGLLLEMLWPRRASKFQWIASMLGLVAAIAAIAQQFRLDLTDGSTLGGMFVRDRFGLVAQLVILIAAFVSILFSEEYLERKRIRFGEFYPL